MEEPFRYRNKAQFPIGVDKEGNLIAGFYAGRTHQIIPVPNRDCVLGVPENKVILDQILDYMREEKISAYDEERHKRAGAPCPGPVWIYNKRDHGLSDH